MGLLAKLFNDASDTEFKLAQDLVAIAMADGIISEAEHKVITEICQTVLMDEREQASSFSFQAFSSAFRSSLVLKGNDAKPNNNPHSMLVTKLEIFKNTAHEMPKTSKNRLNRSIIFNL